MGDPLGHGGVRSDPSRLPPRPIPDRSTAERVAAWVTWFGLGRMVLAAVSVVVVAGGVFWLVRMPSPSVEAVLPQATGAAPQATLPPPSTLDDPAPTTSAPGVPTPGGPSPASAGPEPGPVVVHVAGAVTAPGVYRLDGSPRVNDAIVAAGGARAGAELDALNLAQPLYDGQRLYVPAAGELDEDEIAAGVAELVSPDVRPDPAPAAGSVTATVPSGPVDLNRATVGELETLPGVGPSTAQAIVDDRERNGPFATVDDLDRVPGIGPSKLDALRGLVTV